MASVTGSFRKILQKKSLDGGFLKWGYPKMDGLYKGKSYKNGGLRGSPIYGNFQIGKFKISQDWHSLISCDLVGQMPVFEWILTALAKLRSH
jgi:hypothetical protein